MVVAEKGSVLSYPLKVKNKWIKSRQNMNLWIVLQNSSNSETFIRVCTWIKSVELDDIHTQWVCCLSLTPPSSRPLAAEVLIHIELIYCHFVHLESYLGSTRRIWRIYSHGRVLLYIYLGHLLFIRGSLKRYQRCCWCWCLHKTGKMWSPWALGHLSIFGNIEGKEGQWNKSDFCETQ